MIAGHSHKPRNELRDGVLWFNPGSAGPRRFKLPIALGRLTIEAGPRARRDRQAGAVNAAVATRMCFMIRVSRARSADRRAAIAGNPSSRATAKP